MRAPSARVIREQTIRRSRFVGVVCPFSFQMDIKGLVRELEEAYPRANHYCWAWRISHPREDGNASDAGEPSGTAGRPIQHALAGSGLTQAAVVVVRYFGGIKLGVRGLIEAYGGTAALALEGVEPELLEVCGLLHLELPYDRADVFRHWWTKQGYSPEVLLWEYSESITLQAPLPVTDYTAWEAFRETLAPHGSLTWSLGEERLRRTPRMDG